MIARARAARWRSFLILLGIVVMSSWVVAAQPPGGGTTPPPGGGTAAPPGGGFDFPEEEEEAPSWSDDIRAQAVDIGLVVAFSALAFTSFFRKSVTLKYVTLVASVIYIGFWKSTLLSIVNVFGLFGGNLPIFRYSLAWYLLAAITLVSTILWGRVYCGRICAFGALTQLMDRVLPAKWRFNVPRAIERRASLIKYGILGATIVYFIITGNPGIYPYVEPFCSLRQCSSGIFTAAFSVRSARSSESCRSSPCSASSAGRSARPARSARRPASGARFAGPRSS